MANEEALTIDGLAVNDGITFGMVTFDAPVPRQRQDWIGAADSEAQLLTRNPLHENRKITARISVITQSTMDLAHDKLLLILDKLQKASKYTDGISMTWAPATGTRTATFDVLAGEITDLPVDWENGYLAKAPTLTIELTCKPYWRGTEVLTSTASSSTQFVTLEVASVTGDVPALGRLIVTDTATQSRRHVEWGLEGPLTYNSGTSLTIDSASMVTSGFTGVQNGSVVTGNAVNSPTAIAGLGNQSHVGTFLVRVRFRSDTTGGVAPTLKFRLTWRAGDGPWTSNAWVTHTTGNANYQEGNLGTITVPVASSGTQRWTGQIEAITATAAYESASVDYVTLVPTSDGYGLARAVLTTTTGTMTGFDDFTGTTAGSALNARTAVSGGAWATSGATTDFAFADDLSGEQIKRSTTSDTGPRWAVLGSTNYTDSQVDVLAYRSILTPTGGSVELGAVARWVDSSNYLRAVVGRDATTWWFSIIQRVTGTDTTLATVSLSSGAWAPLRYYNIRLTAFSSGRVLAWLLDSSKTSTIASAEASSTALATSGTLATGKPGIYDYMSGTSGSPQRYYDNFAVTTPAAEPIALYSGRNMQIRYDDVFRQDSAGTYVGRPPSYRGSRFLLPVGTSRVLVKARRNDVETAADSNVTDATQIQVGWTPRGLAVPR